MTNREFRIEPDGEYVVGAGHLVFRGRELIDGIIGYNLKRDEAFSAEAEIGLVRPISITTVGKTVAKNWGNPDCDSGYHAKSRVTFRRWPLIWRLRTESRCWNCDWVEL